MASLTTRPAAETQRDGGTEKKKTTDKIEVPGANLLMELSVAGKILWIELSISRLKAVPSNLSLDVAHSYQLCKLKVVFCENLKWNKSILEYIIQ